MSKAAVSAEQQLEDHHHTKASGKKEAVIGEYVSYLSKPLYNARRTQGGHDVRIKRTEPRYLPLEFKKPRVDLPESPLRLPTFEL